MGALAGGPLLALAGKEQLLGQIEGYPSPASVIEDEDFWKLIRQAYTVSPSLINLNNAGLSPQPKRVQDGEIKYLEWSNETPSYYMWRILARDREIVREGLAKICHASPEEIAINRNATEALGTIIMGMNLAKGDEVVLSHQDYPHMKSAWKQREMRDGIVLKWVDVPLPSEDTEELVRIFTDAFTPRTKVVHLTHMINWSGQMLPVKQISAQAHAQDIKVVVDAAHSYAQMDLDFADMGADYAGVSLHKWLCAPFGTGLLYVQQDHIADLWPMFPSDDPQSDDIRKFEHLGTRSTASEIAIGYAIEFHNLIGIDRKYKRLQYLKRYWLEEALKMPGVSTLSSLDPAYGGAISSINIAGKTPIDIQRVMNREQIHISPVTDPRYAGVRITPNVYTLTAELDRLLEVLSTITQGG